MMLKKLIVCFGLTCALNIAYAQEDGGRIIRTDDEDTEQTTEEQEEAGDSTKVKKYVVRRILNKITFTAALGYGLNNYRTNLKEHLVDYKDGTHYLVQEGATVGVSDWMYAPAENLGYNQGTTLADGDTLKLRGYNHSLPLNIGLHVIIKERFKVGGGIGLEMFSIGDLSIKEPGENFETYSSGLSSALALRYYGTLGYRVQHFLWWDNYADLRIGKWKPITKFDKPVNTGLFFNLGYQMERNFSEFFRFTLRPSIEYHAYKRDINDKDLKVAVPSAYLEAGISLNYPTLPRCPIKSCETQVNHLHYSREYRGQPITRWQNPKMGQNHRELERIKRRKKDDTEQELQYKKPRRKKFFLF